MVKIILPMLLVAAMAIPSDPIWPNQFTQNFTETTNYEGIGTHHNTGTFYYDAISMRYRVDRDNGRYDRYCGVSGPYALEDTPCIHYVVDGNRYLHYPEKNECCYCCNSSHGCGMMKTDWLSGATFEGKTTYDGQSAYKWDK